MSGEGLAQRLVTAATEALDPMTQVDARAATVAVLRELVDVVGAGTDLEWAGFSAHAYAQGLQSRFSALADTLEGKPQ